MANRRTSEYNMYAPQTRQRRIEKCPAAPHSLDDPIAEGKSSNRRLVDKRIHHSAWRADKINISQNFGTGELMNLNTPVPQSQARCINRLSRKDRLFRVQMGVAAGKSNRQIAKQLGVDEGTFGATGLLCGSRKKKSKRSRQEQRSSLCFGSRSVRKPPLLGKGMRQLNGPISSSPIE
jgi:hypothetical protein